MYRTLLHALVLVGLVAVSGTASALDLSSANTWLTEQLAVAGGTSYNLGWLFLGGVLASLLPCVYPLYPITLAMVRARGGENRFVHPLLYYSGLVSVYVMMGILAALTGGMLNEIMRLAVVNIALGIGFFILALSMIDLWQIPFFQPRSIAAGEGALGTLTMGFAAGLLSSACVGPVVVGILLGLAAGAGAVSVEAVFAGGS